LGRVWQRQTGESSVWDGEAPPFIVSFLVHLSAILVLGIWPLAVEKVPDMIIVSSAPVEDMTELKLPEAFAHSELPSQEVGANSAQGALMAMSMAPVVSEVSLLPNRLEAMPVENARIEISNIF